MKNFGKIFSSSKIFEKLYPLEILYDIFLIILFIEILSSSCSDEFNESSKGIPLSVKIDKFLVKLERENFKMIDYQLNIRNEILNLLRNKAYELGILDKLSINLGGSVGIGIYPIEYDKTQILDIIDKNKYNKIIYFGDKYLKDGNDYEIINHKNVIGYKIDNVEDTFKILKYLLENNN